MVWQDSPGPLYIYTQTLLPSIIPRGVEDWADADVARDSTAILVRSSFFIIINTLRYAAQNDVPFRIHVPFPASH